MRSFLESLLFQNCNQLVAIDLQSACIEAMLQKKALRFSNFDSYQMHMARTMKDLASLSCYQSRTSLPYLLTRKYKSLYLLIWFLTHGIIGKAAIIQIPSFPKVFHSHTSHSN